MTQLTPEQIKQNYDTLLSYIESYIASPRKEQVLTLYTDHQDRIAVMPASGTEHYHNCFPGGYVDHVVRVIEGALHIMDLWSTFGATIDYSKEELVFAALNHDLGKIGTEDAEQYIFNDSEWHRKNQGKIYKNNPTNSFMTVPDRSLKLLADRGIPVSEQEWFGIKLHDGMYEDANKSYYVSHDPSSRLRTNLPYVLHQADMMASRVEYEMWVRASKSNHPASSLSIRRKTGSQGSTPIALTEQGKGNLQEVFNQMFKP